MSPHVERASRWIYGGLWGVLVRWFKVPDHPPTLPVPVGERMESFRPSEGFLRYLKFLFWIALTAFDVPLIFAWIVITIRYPVTGALLALPVLILAAVPDIV